MKFTIKRLNIHNLSLQPIAQMATLNLSMVQLTIMNDVLRNNRSADITLDMSQINVRRYTDSDKQSVVQAIHMLAEQSTCQNTQMSASDMLMVLNNDDVLFILDESDYSNGPHAHLHISTYFVTVSM